MMFPKENKRIPRKHEKINLKKRNPSKISKVVFRQSFIECRRSNLFFSENLISFSKKENQYFFLKKCACFQQKRKIRFVKSNLNIKWYQLYENRRLCWKHLQTRKGMSSTVFVKIISKNIQIPRNYNTFTENNSFWKRKERTWKWLYLLHGWKYFHSEIHASNGRVTEDLRKGYGRVTEECGFGNPIYPLILL